MAQRCFAGGGQGHQHVKAAHETVHQARQFDLPLQRRAVAGGADLLARNDQGVHHRADQFGLVERFLEVVGQRPVVDGGVQGVAFGHVFGQRGVHHVKARVGLQGLQPLRQRQLGVLGRVLPDVRAHHGHPPRAAAGGRLPRYIGEGPVAHRVVAAVHAQGVKYRGQVSGMAGKKAHRVQAVGGLEHAGARDQPKRRLHAPDAAKTGWPDDAARRLRAQCSRHHTECHRHGRAAAAGARRALGGPRVEGLAQRVNGKLGGHGLARHQGTGTLQVEDRAGVVAGREAGPQGAAHLGGEVSGVEDVLHRHWHGFQGAQRRAAAQAHGSSPRCRQQFFAVKADPGLGAGFGAGLQLDALTRQVFGRGAVGRQGVVQHLHAVLLEINAEGHGQPLRP